VAASVSTPAGTADADIGTLMKRLLALREERVR
jgi:hypothetical protein